MDEQFVKEKMQIVRENIGKVIVGKDSVIELILTVLLAGGNVLLEDVPGTGKTMLAKSLAKSIKGKFSRIQFTADLLPSDVTGLHFYNQKKGEFVLQKGPVFTNILLADEINRATPRTQSSLLECMEEQQVTLDGETLGLDMPFFVIATENPIETAGTFPLPEAQLDRFMMKISMGLPDFAQELEIMNRYIEGNPYTILVDVVTIQELVEMQKWVKHVHIEQDVKEYLLHIVESTRNSTKIKMGVSTRGTLVFMRACQAFAAIRGRNYVIPEDVKYLAPYVMEHRLVLAGGYLKEAEQKAIIQSILASTPVPTEKYQV